MTKQPIPSVLAIAAIFVIAVIGIGQAAGQRGPDPEWVVFFDHPISGFAIQTTVPFETITSLPSAVVRQSMPALGAFVVRMSEFDAKSLENAHGVRAVVPNIVFTVGPASPPEAVTMGFTVQATPSPRITPNAALGGIALGNQVQFDLRITNIGFVVIKNVEVALQVLDAPAGAVQTTDEPGPNEYRIDWYNPVAETWTPLDGNTIHLPPSYSVLLGGQGTVRVRITLGRPGPTGGYQLGHTIAAGDESSTVSVNSIAPIPWHIDRVRAEHVWPWTKGGGVRVAVLDTGIDANHASLTVAGTASTLHREDQARHRQLAQQSMRKRNARLHLGGHRLPGKRGRCGGAE